MNKITAVIVAKNYPQYLFQTIDSVKDFVSEIIIVDIGLDDKLKQKLTQDPVIRLIDCQETVSYVELIREKTKSYATSNYLLFLDPDEIIPENLKKILGKKLLEFDYFSIPRKNIIFGRWIKHSRWWPDYQVRLFKKNKVIWPKKIHQPPQLSGNGLIIDPKEELAIIHYNYENLDEFFSKMIRYAKAEATEYLKQNKQLYLAETIKKSLSEFISRYFAENGYKDGFHGFVLAFLQMIYYFIVYFYFWEEKKYQSHETNKTTTDINNFFRQGLIETNYWLMEKKLLNPIKKTVKKLQNIFLSLFK